MRVIVPYTEIHPLAEAALTKYAPTAERFPMGTALDAYWTLVSDLWARGESFALIEHDIEIAPKTVPSFLRCPSPWCVFAYNGPTKNDLLTGALGCTKFHAKLMAKEPDLLVKVGQIDDAFSPVVVRDWRRLDARMLGVLRERGYEPHVHNPPVLHHHHFANFGCACGQTHD